MQEVDSDMEVGPFFDAIVDEKYFDGGRENNVSMVGEGSLKLNINLGSLLPI